MSRKPMPDAMVKGMIMGANLLRKLVERVVEKGGHPEMIHFLTTDRGEETLEKLAEVILMSPWQIPRSLMERLTVEYGGVYGEFRDTDIYDWWGRILNEGTYHLEVPELFFDHNCDRETGAQPCPQEVIDQLRGRIRPADVIIVKLNGEDYIVTQIGVGAPEKIGEPLFTRDEELEYVDLAPLRFFDLTR